MDNSKAIKTLETVNGVILGKQAQMRLIMRLSGCLAAS